VRWPSSAITVASTSTSSSGCFCEGCNLYSPAWQHAAEYWDTAKRWPEKVLFLRYKEILHDPAKNIWKLAEHIECPFTVVEWAAGMVYTISCANLQRAEETWKAGIRSADALDDVSNDAMFTRWVTGNCTNHMTPEIVVRLD
jgi:hypothetical protein